jgi:uronate dehydrogenase
LVIQSLTAPISAYRAIWGVSANTQSWWDNTEAAELGYKPLQNAEDFAAEIMKADGRHWNFQGGSFAEG